MYDNVNKMYGQELYLVCGLIRTPTCYLSFCSNSVELSLEYKELKVTVRFSELEYLYAVTVTEGFYLAVWIV